MKQEENVDLTQAEIFAAQLKKLSADVTAEDRKIFLELYDSDSDTPIGRSTLSNYLNGRVYDNDTAVIVIKFFKERIASRFKKIA